ncbi:glycine cleavage system protein H [Saccharomonospora piscinae]|uniref:Glycine cleavage system H protein n=1 Tax=Saccharomonospora piscinae TaxID=687388 RepID=A0A1V9A9Q8_SACPI|nr:glycine cleavage system protein GcvH [Saccharomonospora piscinae]OQO93811.1 glycine cleavage system protein H [Saccharomonospora piscinae]TLW94972.1 glycine cleavage system protein GcvH [Saccharomonospora piscinae]
MSVPEELRYTEEHEWVAAVDGGRARVGITAYAQDQLGDVVFVELPEVGIHLTAGATFGEIESTKSVSELFAPVDGEVLAVNDAVVASPELVNSDPYGEGWLVELALDDAAAPDSLLDAQGYRRVIDN